MSPRDLRRLCEGRGFDCYYDRPSYSWYVLGDAGRGPETVWYGSATSLRTMSLAAMTRELDQWERGATPR